MYFNMDCCVLFSSSSQNSFGSSYEDDSQGRDGREWMDVLEMEKGIEFIAIKHSKDILAALRNIREVDFHTFAMGTCLSFLVFLSWNL